MKRYTTVIFDMDGTLMDTLQDIANSVNVALQKFKLPARNIDEIRSFVGDGVRDLMERAVRSALREIADEQRFTNDLVEQTLHDFHVHYREHCKDCTMPYSGIMELLADLKAKGYKMAIVSNKPQREISVLCKEYFADYINVAIGENEAEGIGKKPAPDMVFAALQQLGESVEQSIYVGDSDVDFMTSVNAGLNCISVLWGFRTEEFLRSIGAKTFANVPNDIVQILEA